MALKDAVYQFSNDELIAIRSLCSFHSLSLAKDIKKKSYGVDYVVYVLEEIATYKSIIQRINIILAARTNGGI